MKQGGKKNIYHVQDNERNHDPTKPKPKYRHLTDTHKIVGQNTLTSDPQPSRRPQRPENDRLDPRHNPSRPLEKKKKHLREFEDVGLGGAAESLVGRGGGAGHEYTASAGNCPGGK